MIRHLACFTVITAFWYGSGQINTASAQYTGANSRFIYSATRNFLYNRPTVSPYRQSDHAQSPYNGLPNYYTLVRPQIEQREENMARQQQTSRLQTQINQAQRQAAESQSQMANMMLTGALAGRVGGCPVSGPT